MSDPKGTPIIKKVKKVNGSGHHGGAWKVAYADFVTAMMAFFLLMWLLNATSEEQRRGLSNYFGPAGDIFGAGGTGGILGGQSVETEGNFKEARASSPITTGNVKSEASASNTDTDDNDGLGAFEEDIAAEKAIEKAEEELFKKAEEELKKAIQENPELNELAQHLIIDQTPEGLRIQIVDRDKKEMFPNGSSEMFPHTRKLLELVNKVIHKMPNKISITGHTDAKQYANGSKYTNWELSSDRANATRRVMLELGLSPERMVYVSGKAETEPLLKEDPTASQNRRISIILHRREMVKSLRTPQKK